MYKANLFDSWTLKFLPELPEMETEDGMGRTESVPQRPLRDNAFQSHLCFKNGVVVIKADRDPVLLPYAQLPKEIFVWQSQVPPFTVMKEILELGPHGVWSEFMQNASKELQKGTWVVNHGMLSTLRTAYGYLLHDYTPPDLRKAVVLYDRTSGIREGGAGKSILCDGINTIRPYHWVDGKRLKNETRFIMEGYTEDKRVVLFSDILQNWNLEDYYNLISDGFTVEGKGKPVFVVPKKFSPKLLINTNYTIPAVSRSDRRRLHFVPISQFYGILSDSQGITPADLHGGYLLDDAWSEEDWTSFYVTCIFCIHEYLQKGLLTFDDSVLADRQLLAAASYDDSLLQVMKDFIDEVIASGGTCRKDQMLQLFETEYEIERWKDYKSNWKTRRFKEIAAGMGYQINPGRANERYQQLINGEMVDFFELVKPVQPVPIDPRQSSTSAPEQEAPKEAEPPVVKEGRFAGFLFGEEN